MDKETAVILRNKKDSKRIRQCRVVFSYKQDHEDELNLNVGDVIDILGEEEEGWWRGILNGKIGVFPSNFVEEINCDKLKNSREDLNSNDGDNHLILPPKPAKILCEVKYSYKAQNEDELSLKEGDVITLVSKDGQDPGWWKGELNGVIGVFPDNFVAILPYSINDKSPIINQDSFPLKTSSIASQRKSLENRNLLSDKVDSLAHGDSKVSPPVPSKKPAIAVKKSPSASNSTGGLFSGIKKKLVDVVDGATSSKTTLPAKTESPDNDVLVQVDRVSLLVDVRATRPKAPAGRRPPSRIFRDEETPLPNGLAEPPLNLEVVSEQSGSSDTDGAEVKPKLREWEKHKAPWLAEMKLNQAKRTSPSPGPPENKPRLTPTERNDNDDAAAKQTTKPDADKTVTTTTTTTPTSTKTKPDVEKVPLRPKPNLALNSNHPRPASIHQSASSVIPAATDAAQKPPTPAALTKMSPIARTPSPSVQKFDKADAKSNNDADVTITFKQYTELVERIQKLELIVEKQHVVHTAAIDELKGKLQLETEMRHMLQVQLEKVASSQNLMQVPDPGERNSSFNTAVSRTATLPEERLNYNYYNVLYLCITTLGLAIVTLSSYWCSRYASGFPVGSVPGVISKFDTHVSLSLIGYIFLYSQTIIFTQTLRYLPRWWGRYFIISRDKIFWINFTVGNVILLLEVLGIQAAFDFNRLRANRITKMFSLHAWLGLFSIILLCLDLLLSLVRHVFKLLSFAAKIRLSQVCWMCRTLSFITAVITCLLGLKTTAIIVYNVTYSSLPCGAVLLNVIGILLMVCGSMVLHLFQRGKKIVQVRNSLEIYRR